MEDSFLSLKEEVQSSKDLRTCIEMLIEIFRNTVYKPEEKYRTLRTENKAFNASIWKFDAGKQIMMDCGWILEGDNVVLPPEKDLTVPLLFLVENRDVKPSVEEWVSETKHIIPNADKEKERQLRQEAFVKKEKEMIELQKDMAEREAIKARILAEHRHDQEKRKVPVGGSSKNLDQPAPAARSAVTTPRRVSSSNVLGGAKGPDASSLLRAGGVSIAHHRSPAFPHPSTQSMQQFYQQPAEGGHHLGRHTPGTGNSSYFPSRPSFGTGRHSAETGSDYYQGRHTAPRPFQRFNDEGTDGAPLRLGRGAAAGRGYGGDKDYDDHDY